MKIIAHRGYSGKYPELTRIAFEEALKLPIVGIECDVQLTKDEQIVVFHDPVLDRTSDHTGRVADHTYAELQKVNVGTAEQPQQIMLLDELLELLNQYPGKELFLETKHHDGVDDPRLEPAVAKLLEAKGLDKDQRISLITFNHLAVRRLAELLPALDTYYLTAPQQSIEMQDQAWSASPEGVGPSIDEAKEYPSVIGRDGKMTYVWTVDEPADMLWCRDSGVDSLGTNLPELALETLG